MPSVFLSPSTQEYNIYVTDGRSEEYYMNLIADAMIPYLQASGIEVIRNDPSLTVGGSVRLSEAAQPEVHLAIHSNASPEVLSGQIQGTDVYYYRGSAASEAFAQLIAANMAAIYPNPGLVGVTPTRSLYELNNTSAPAALVEVAYHDNYEDAQWITDNIQEIAAALALSVTQYFGLPFVLPDTVQRGVVTTDGYAVNIRSAPQWSAPTVGVVPNGASVIITGVNGQWYIVDYNGTVGYISSSLLSLA